MAGEPLVPEKIVFSMVKTCAPADNARKTAPDIEKDAVDRIAMRDIPETGPCRTQGTNPGRERNRLVYDGAVKKRSG